MVLSKSSAQQKNEIDEAIAIMSTMKEKVNTMSAAQTTAEKSRIIFMIDDLAEKLGNQILLASKLEQLMMKMGSLDDVAKSIENMQKNNLVLVEKINKMESDMNRRFGNVVDHLLTLDAKYQEMGGKILQLEDRLGQTTPVHKCTYCRVILPCTLPIRSDGLSIMCPNPQCQRLNVLSKPKRCRKFMFMNCCEFHFQQFHAWKRPGTKERCKLCGQMAKVFNFLDYNTFAYYDDMMRYGHAATGAVKPMGTPFVFQKEV